MPNVSYIDEAGITGKRVLLRLDLNVTLNPDHSIADDARISQSLPTINYLLKNRNRLIIVSHLGRPKGRDSQYSLKVVADKLHSYLQDCKVTLVDDFTAADKSVFNRQEDKEILILENIRFYPEEKENNVEFAKKLADLADVFVNDAFGVCHRTNASVTGVAQLIPSFAGLLLKKEINIISKAIENPQKPFVAILGGAKISSKLNLIGRLTNIADSLLIGGGMANTLIQAQGYEIGKSLSERAEINNAKRILAQAGENNKQIILPKDVVVNDSPERRDGEEVKKIIEIPSDKSIFDIGPETQAVFGSVINKAKTIIWNGPMGYIENPDFRRGTEFIYYSITQNQEAVSIVGGGDTIAAISKQEYLDKITHISTGGGAMLEFIEKGTLPGIEALKR
jgi:phosphoglycerate kinase